MTQVDILKEFGNELLVYSNPLRYLGGGEYSYGEKKELSEIEMRVGLCFPDMYEIGMSNNAMMILYNQINSHSPKILCDRVFAVANDFESALREKKLPLVTLEYGFPLNELDLLGFSVGYELSATNILQVLDLGNIPIECENRNEKDPIVIAGGPALTNPLPFSKFFDFVYIGEAEPNLDEILQIIHNGKLANFSREAIVSQLKELPYLYHYKKKRTKRVSDQKFGQGSSLFNYYVVPNFKIAQDNGNVEIMRGCPNGCRFCHAGQFYKPYRQKDYKTIKKQVNQYVNEFGYREITLSSLSSADHPQLKEIIFNLNQNFENQNISFALPSLKVDSFALDILEELSKVRKSGLTFAIETPLSKWQHTINKIVSKEHIITIINEAKQRGWKLAKFYFMVGLPTVDLEEEKKAIVEFLKDIREETNIGLNINIGTFVPKAHTPFQWVPQLNLDVSSDHLRSLKNEIQQEVKGARVFYHDPFTSFLEGIISRGDESVSNLILEAYKKGCRLDAWNEYFKKEVWAELVNLSESDIRKKITTGFDLEEQLPWDGVSLGVSKTFLRSEYLAAMNNELTQRCYLECLKPCGVCNKNNKVIEISVENIPIEEKKEVTLKKPFPLLFTYKKFGRGIFVSHINVMRLFEQTFQRAKVDVAFTLGFNPKPKMEFLNPLSTGISGENELALIYIHNSDNLDYDELLKTLNSKIGEGFLFKDVKLIKESGKVTLSKFIKQSHYTITDIIDEKIKTHLETLPGTDTDKYTISKRDNAFDVYVKGENNLIKLLFSKDIDKFQILSKMRVHRNKIELDYPIVLDFNLKNKLEM